MATKSGDLDTTFGTGGLVSLTDMFHGHSRLMSDGKILSAAPRQGTASVVVRRTLTDGSPDPTFGLQGGVIVDLYTGSDVQFELGGLAFQSDEKVVLAGRLVRDNGYNDSMLFARLNQDGMLDPSFGAGGTEIITVSEDEGEGVKEISIQNDDKIVATGELGSFDTHKPFILRLDKHGKLDQSFGTGGISSETPRRTQLYNITLLPDGKILLGGMSGLKGILGRFQGNGQLDLSFGEGGLVYFGPFRENYEDVKVVAPNGPSDDRAITGGSSLDPALDASLWLARVLGNGSIDSSFNGGKPFIPVGTGATSLVAAAVQPDGKIVYLSTSDDMYPQSIVLGRVHENGEPDLSFGDQGMVVTRPPIGNGWYGRRVEVQEDGKLLVFAWTHSNMLMARYLG